MKIKWSFQFLDLVDLELGLGPLFKLVLAALVAQHSTHLSVGQWVLVLLQCNNGPPRITAPVRLKAATHPIHMTHKHSPNHKLRAGPPNSCDPPNSPGFSDPYYQPDLHDLMMRLIHLN